ncbi:MAG: alpha/beta fold hydrolase [Deltaproteobacteria bacterium]
MKIPDDTRQPHNLIAEGTRPLFREMTVETGAARLNVAVGPDNGPLLVCIHGVGRSWRDFLQMLPGLVPWWNVLCPDLRGHGKSARVPERYLVDDYLGDIGSLLEHLGRPVILLGHSLGALLSLAAAARWPQRVRAVVAEDPPSEKFLARIFDTTYAPVFQAMQRLAGTALDAAAVARELGEVVVSREAGGAPVRLADIRDAASLRFSARCLRDVDRDVYKPVLARRWMDGLDFHGLLPRVVCPVLLLRGDETRGGMLPRADADAILDRLPDGMLVEFPGVGHQIHWLDCGNMVRVTLNFLESVP